MTKIAREQP
jgi:hypothetical protein